MTAFLFMSAQNHFSFLIPWKPHNYFVEHRVHIVLIWTDPLQ